jgi:hypothetical protein
MKCQCGCGCRQAAVTTDVPSGVRLCEACSEYVVIGAVVICSRQAELEALPDGAWRLPPPPPPPTDPEGPWALWWETVPAEDSRLVARYATRRDAEQALRSLDWPRPGDHTQYLCGYTIRPWDQDDVPQQDPDGTWRREEDPRDRIRRCGR